MPSSSTRKRSNIEILEARPVPPDAVRVWRGFRLSTLKPVDFRKDLGSIFIPATAQLQRLYGLTAYLPTVLPAKKAKGLPDEIALVFYESQQAYNDTTKTVVGRAYSLLHQTVFAFPTSQTGFPNLLASSIEFDTPYYLFRASVDWQGGFTQVFVGTRPSSIAPAKFLSQFQALFAKQQARPAEGLDGGIVCTSSDWVLYWEHWLSEPLSKGGRISLMPKLADTVILQPYVTKKIKSSLTDQYKGVGRNVQGKSFNILFPRS
jgi:hypothetical protein